MKRWITLSLSIIFVSASFSQTATLRLQGPDEMPEAGGQFLVGVWLDALEYEPVGIRSAQLFIEYNGEVITPVSKDGSYAINLHPVLAGLESNPLSNSPFSGDLRFVILAATEKGVLFDNLTAYPVKLWDIIFTYHGGQTSLEWGNTYLLEPVEGQEIGGVLKRGTTLLSTIDNKEYEMTLKGTLIGSE